MWVSPVVRHPHSGNNITDTTFYRLGNSKSSVGLALAQSLHCCFIDADDLHPKENVEKMAHGHPLTDTVSVHT